MTNQSELKSMCNFRDFLIKYVLVSIISFLCLAAYAQTVNYDIRLNQIGYYPNLEKKAFVVGSTSLSSFSIQSVDHATTFFTGTFGTGRLADFSSFTTAGNYVLFVPEVGYSAPFVINSDVFKDLSAASIKGYYYKRASTAITAEHGGVYARAAGHPDTQVMIHASAASPDRPAGTIVSSPKGWYDAGDYNCYVVNSNISTYTLLAAYEHFSSYYDTLNLNIPESGNGIPDILNEIKWNLDWMLTMQDPYDGRVYDKKTSANFSDFIMPDEDQAQRYLVGKSAGATYGFAAVMAVAYRVYLPYDAAYANQCLAAAKKAYASGANGYSYNPPDIFTGVYNSQSNEGAWAAVELYISTKNDVYYVPNYQNFCLYVPKWYQVNTVGLMSLVHHRKNLTAIGFADTTKIKNSLLAFANPVRSSMGFTSVFAGEWGDNSFALNAGMMDICAYLITKDQRYLNSAIYILDFVLGKNGSGYCYVTSFGSKKVMYPHDRISSADGIANPIPGWVIGGGGNYVDVEARYDLNEVAINWNAPLVFLTGAVQYVNRNDIYATIEVSKGSTSVLSNNQYALSLGSAMVNEAANVASFTIKNSGTVPLTITSLTGTTGFEINTFGSLGSIDPGATFVFSITATPAHAGLNTGTIKIVSNDLVTPVFTLNVSVKGKVNGQSLLEVLNGTDEIFSNNDPFLLGSSETDMPATSITITLSNSGTVPLVINSITSVPGFEISTLSPSGSIEVGTSATFTIIATPEHPGVNEGQIMIETNDPANQTFLLIVSINGIGPLLKVYQSTTLYNGGAQYTFSPAVILGNQAMIAFIIKNEGTSVLTLDLPVLTGPFETLGYIPSSLNPNAEASFGIIFKPLVVGLNMGTINFSGNVGEIFTLNFSGTGTLATATVGVLATDAILISPNPTKQDISIQMNGEFSNVSINMYNTLGEQISSTTMGHVSNTSIQLTLINVASGMYIIEIVTDQGNSMKRVVKE